MSCHDHDTKRPSSDPGSSSTTGIFRKEDAIANQSRSEQTASTELPYLQRAQSLPVYGSSNISESLRRSKKPTFKIDLPDRSSMYRTGLSKVIPGGLHVAEHLKQSIVTVQQSLLPPFLAPFHLTPPPEELPFSPLDSASLGTLPGFLKPSVDLKSSATEDMASDRDIDQQCLSQGNDVQDISAIESSKLDFNAIAAFVVDELAKLEMSPAAMSMVHQPLPFPLPQRLLNNDHSITVLYSILIGALRSDNRLPTTAIRVFHTLLDKIPTEYHPNSPPVTPSYLSRNSNQQAQGYFTIKPLYPSISFQSGLAVPPGEALVSITERMIPPSGEFDISSFLNDTLDSGFSERINELSKGGLYVLVLPTHNGGHTFHQEYLSRLLDPILRNIIVRLGLRSQLATDISNVVALNQLLPFEAMREKIERLLTNANNSIIVGSSQPQYQLISNQKGTIQLPFEAWYTWWSGQERNRISGLLNYHLNVQGQGAVSGISRASIVLELEEQMQAAGSARGQVETGIELATYIIQRIS